MASMCACPVSKLATLMASPVVGGKVAGVDQAAALKVPGVRQVVVLDDLVAVVGDHFWAARQGLIALAPRWNDGPNGTRDFQANHGGAGRRRRTWSGGQDRGQCRQGSCPRPACRCRLSVALPVAFADGALEFHRACHAPGPARCGAEARCKRRRKTPPPSCWAFRRTK